MSPPGAAARRQGHVEVRWRIDGVLLCTLRDYQDASTIGRLVDLCRARVAERTPRAVLFDATAMDGFSTDVRAPGLALLEVIRTSGTPRAVAITSSGAVRMVATALAFAAGLPMELVESVEAADHRVAQILAGRI